ncbi:hypothetical protein [Streptomyces sp. NPDC007369]|uniref:hypothetical protein n=1 Tax=Streptomyces sp. NPDC007369 TaxID=3154589 RepID=UPI0033E85410
MRFGPDTRLLVASGLESGLAALPPVYAAGAGLRTLPLTKGVLAAVGPLALSAPDRPLLHEPLLLLRLRRPLADEAVVVRCRPEGADAELPVVVFAPFSGAGTLLPAFLPESGGPLKVTAKVHLVAAPHCHAEVPAEADRGPELPPQQAAEVIEGVLLEGLLARLAFLATLEKQRIIRQAREISACRHAELAFSGALDSLGQDLGVLRLPDEDDTHYRNRLAIFTSWRLPTRPTVAETLNGPGQDGVPNAGLPSRVGVTARFRVVEEQNPLALATRLVHVGAEGAARRARFHRMLRSLHLLDLDAPVAAVLPPGRRRRLEEVRQVLTTQVTRPTGPPAVRHLGPGLAEALARLVLLVRALGDTGKVTLRRAHVEEPDPLHELGLGATLDAFGEQRLTAMAAAVPALALQNTELGAIARSLVPRPFAQDPVGRWLAAPCGLRTVHAIGEGAVFVSTLPMSGLTVDGPQELAPGGSAVFQARHSTDTSTGGLHVLAAEAVRRAGELFPQRQLGQVPAPLTGAALDTAVRAVAAAEGTVPPPDMAPLVTGDLLAGRGSAFTREMLEIVVLDQVVAYPFPKAQLTGLGSGDALRNEVDRRVQALLDSGFYSVQGVWDGPGNRMLLLAAVCLLPGRPPKHGEAPPAEFRWYATGLPASAQPLALSAAMGGRTEVTGTDQGLSLLVCLAHARRGLAEPYGVRVDLPEGVRLNRDQYGYVMNLLESLCPLGIEINTVELRRSHLDFGGEPGGPAAAPDASRTYHRYRRPRRAGRSS